VADVHVTATILDSHHAGFRSPTTTEKRHDVGLMAMDDVPVPAFIGSDTND
jgi:hypothetical protein